MSRLEHGGALRAAMRAWPAAPEPWIDLSTGLNPAPYPVSDLAPEVWTRLPEPEDVQGLEDVARTAYGASTASDVVAAPGAQSLIQLMPTLFAARRVAVLGPTYEEHAARWRASGARVRVAATPADVEADEDTVVVVNPNNPDGRLLCAPTLARLAASTARRGGRLVIDESFVDVLPREASYAPSVGSANVIVLRSFGKAYGLGGLRLGFAIAARTEAARIRDALGPWAVSGPAIAIGQRALGDDLWLAATRARLDREAMRLDGLLVDAGLSVLGGTPLFRLAAHRRAGEVYDQLCAHGILTRRFRHAATHLRLGLPGNETAWARLARALRSVDQG